MDDSEDDIGFDGSCMDGSVLDPSMREPTMTEESGRCQPSHADDREHRDQDGQEIKIGELLGNPTESKLVSIEDEAPVSVQYQCHDCGKLFNSNRNLRLHEKRQHSGVSKIKKAQTFSNSFKLEVLEKVKEIGVVAARKHFDIHENTIKGWVCLARGDFTCDQCGKGFIGRAQLKSHIEQRHESESDDKSQGHEVVYHSIEVKREVVACALATSNKEAARKYKIEESTIRAWVKKLERGSELAVAPKRGYFQQKYSQQFKDEVVECAKTMSRKEVGDKFNVPGPTIRMWVLQAQGLPYCQRPVKAAKAQVPLKDFLLASGKQMDIPSEPPKQLNSKAKNQEKKDNDMKFGEDSFDQGLWTMEDLEGMNQIYTDGESVDPAREYTADSSFKLEKSEEDQDEEDGFVKCEPDEIKFEIQSSSEEEEESKFELDDYNDHDDSEDEHKVDAHSLLSRKKRKIGRFPGEPKKPQTVYLLWLNTEGREKVKQENPGISFTEVTRKAGELWAGIDKETKEQFEEKAKAAKEKFDKDYKKWYEEGGEEAIKEAQGKGLKKKGWKALEKTRLPGQPKKPQSAYLLWLNSEREMIKEENPGISFTEVTRKAGEIWNSIDKETKEQFEEKARIAMEKYKKVYKQWFEDGGEEAIKEAQGKSPKKKGWKASRSPKEEKDHTCPICGRTLSRTSNYELQRHIATHSGERFFKCDECGSGFSRIQDLNRHKKIHEGYCPFRCNQCKAGFKAEIALRAHKSSIHNDQTMTNSESDVWPFSCNQCESRFQTSTTFGKHMKLLHGVGNPFICDTCGIGLSTNDNLKRHVKVAHSDMKPFNCEECGKMFGQKSQLVKHQLQHARANGSLTLEQEQMLESEKRICNLCGMELSCAVTLQRHMRTHDPNGTKCHTCEECGKAYSDKRNLQDHISIVHQQMKKFPCTICGKQFGRKTNLQVHMKKTHTGWMQGGFSEAADNYGGGERQDGDLGPSPKHEEGDISLRTTAPIPSALPWPTFKPF